MDAISDDEDLNEIDARGNRKKSTPFGKFGPSGTSSSRSGGLFSKLGAKTRSRSCSILEDNSDNEEEFSPIMPAEKQESPEEKAENERLYEELYYTRDELDARDPEKRKKLSESLKEKLMLKEQRERKLR